MKFYEELDILIIDTKAGASDFLFEIADKIIIPTTLTPIDVKYANWAINYLLKLKYPRSISAVIVNKNVDNILSQDDMREIFKNGNN